MKPPQRTEAERIAGTLTKAQREVFARSTTIGCVPHSEATRRALQLRDLAVPLSKYERAMDWTPLGLAVRAHLLSQDQTDER